MSGPHTTPPGGVGPLIRHWRRARGLSQMALALEVGVSARHMSFVETGRARPGRGVLLRVVEVLDLPGREENALLEAAGYARRYRETGLADPELRQVKRVLRFLLDRHEPHSALVFDGSWNIVMSNTAHRRAVEVFAGRPLRDEVRDNLLRLTFHPAGLRGSIVNWDVVAPVIMARVEREASESPSMPGLRDLLEEITAYGPIPSRGPHGSRAEDLLLPVHLRKGGVDVRLFSVLSTIGTARDVTLQELRLETFFPADPASEAALVRLAATPASSAGP